MALDPASTWGEAVAAAIKAVGVSAGTPVSDTQLEAVWTAVKTEDRDQLTTKAEVTSNGSTETHAAGAAAAIVNLDGDIS